MNIEQALRDAASRGRISLTVIAVSDGKYQASMSVGGNAYRVGINADPVVALIRALADRPVTPETADDDAGVFG